MKPALSATSSDLERAQALSRVLSRPTFPLPRPASERAVYTRLPKSTMLTTPLTLAALPQLERGTRWPALVIWAQQVTCARAAFAVDAKGLLIAAAGIDDGDATRVGGRLALAFDQCAQLGHIRAMHVDGEGETLTMMAICDEDDVPVLLGILGHPAPIPVQALVSAAHAALTATP